MTDSLIVFAPLFILALVLLFPFIGCTGEDPVLIAQEKAAAAEAGKAAAEGKLAEQEKKKEAAKYGNVILVAPGLVSYWRLSEGESGDTTAKDSAPDAPKNGTYMNGAGGGVSRNVDGILALVTEPGDKAAEFDGVKGFVEIPFDLLLQCPLEFSVELWVRPAGIPAAPQVVFASYQVDAAGALVSGVVVEVVPDPSAAPGAAPWVRARVGKGGGFTPIEASLGDGLEHDGWRHVVVTYKVLTKQLMLYVNADNGLPDAELGSAPLSPVIYVANQGSPLRIGAGLLDQTAPTPTPGSFFKGRIDEVALYNVALDGKTVQTHFRHAISVPL